MELLQFINWFFKILVIYTIIYGIGTWKLFKIAKKDPWKSFVPILNLLTTLRIMNRPWWWIIILFIPIVGPILQIVIFVDLLRCYNLKGIKHTFLCVLLGIFYVGYINYKSNVNFLGIEHRNETFISSILFAIIFASVIHIFIIQPYTIPTSSMERTLLVGDFLFVSKLNYGVRIPMTPFGIPFLHSKIPGTGLKSHNQINSYIDAIRIPYIRFPGWETIKRYDIVTFNYPTDSSHSSIDRKDPYIKRCLGLPGDTILFRNGRAFVNNKEEKLPKDSEIQFSYIGIVHGELSTLKIKKLIGFSDFEVYKEGSSSIYFFKGLTKNHAKEISSWSNVIEFREKIDNIGYKIEKFYDKQHSKIDSTNTIFPEDKKWNSDQYGPLYIPKKGDIIKLNKENITQYYNIITRYEGNKKIEIDGDKILINKQYIKQYKIKKNYYFMVGDNRDASLDSRFFGYVPDDHILGKPIFVWLSLQGVFDSGNLNIRFERMFKVVNTGDLYKTSYFPHFLVFLTIYFFYDFYILSRKNKK